MFLRVKAGHSSPILMRENLKSYGWFMQDSIELTDKWIVLAGLRYDRFDVFAGKGRPFITNTDA
ncbi:TonB-dependent receptor domain-containing protein [Yersinia enterocolitica]|uniref:TonB-dependent receptor domain-containing protein n=1 Tax=Yersinia enterocolitica TaxID=630 RepID=UPI00398D4A42